MNKKYLAFSLLGVLVLGLGSATLINYFGQIEQTVTVDQGLSVDGKAWNVLITESMDTSSLENPVFTSVHYLDNNADVEASVTMTSSCSGAGSCAEVDRKYYATNLKSGSLDLTLKDSSWGEITGDTDVVVTYSTNVATGETKVDSITGMPSGYTLIYYADEEFDSNGVRLVTPGQAYALSVGSIIPISSMDGNLKDVADYCSSDGYTHCRGIKLWAINDAIVNNRISWSGDWQSTYYFETNMLGWNHVTGELPNPVDVPSNSKLDFVIVSEFQVGTYPGTYTLDTEIDLA